MRLTFLCPHLRIAGGVRAILTYADRLAALGHAVAVVVPAKGAVRALRRRLAGAGPAWMPGFRARVRWVGEWDADGLPDGDALVELALAERPDLIIADMYMDETGGVPAPVALEMYPDLAVIPVILIASAADPELSAVGPLNGVPVLVKPFASDRLAAEIEKAAKKTGRETQR